MLQIAPYLAFAGVSLMMALSPGPSWVYTVSTALGRGRRAGMIGNAGNSAGILCHALVATAGLTALVGYSVAVFQILKFAGAAYLVYLGVQAFRSRGVFSAAADRSPRTSRQIFRDGLLVNALNPKMVLLFVALLPQFVDAAAGPPALQIAVMGAMHAAIAFVVHTHVVFLSGEISRRMSASGRIQQFVRRALGCVFVGFGVRLAFSGRS